MSGPAQSPRPPAQAIEMYEALRGRWCGEAQPNACARAGLDLLLYRGMSAWMNEPPAASPVAALAAPLEIDKAISAGWRTQAPAGSGRLIPAACHIEAASLLVAMAFRTTGPEARA